MVLGNTNNTVNIYMFMIFSIETSPHKSSIFCQKSSKVLQK